MSATVGRDPAEAQAELRSALERAAAAGETLAGQARALNEQITALSVELAAAQAELGGARSELAALAAGLAEAQAAAGQARATADQEAAAAAAAREKEQQAEERARAALDSLADHKRLARAELQKMLDEVKKLRDREKALEQALATERAELDRAQEQLLETRERARRAEEAQTQVVNGGGGTRLPEPLERLAVAWEQYAELARLALGRAAGPAGLEELLWLLARVYYGAAAAGDPIWAEVRPLLAKVQALQRRAGTAPADWSPALHQVDWGVAFDADGPLPVLRLERVAAGVDAACNEYLEQVVQGARVGDVQQVAADLLDVQVGAAELALRARGQWGALLAGGARQAAGVLDRLGPV